jgi:serine/threonine protein kinase
MAGATVTDADIIGTPLYLAPEIIAGAPFDARVDMYAVGCTAHEMLTGRPPYGGTIKELLHAHVHAPLPLVAALVREPRRPGGARRGDRPLPRQAPEDRYADMNDLEAALCEAQIASGLVTGWDDLALPDVADNRRDLLRRRMPDPLARPRPDAVLRA